MLDINHYDSPAVQKVANICRLLDEEVQQQPKTSRKIIATMYYLASLRIKYAFGFDIKNFHEGHKEVFALSGFKKPINELLATYSEASNANAEAIRMELIQLSNHFDDRFGEITQRGLPDCEYLNTTAQLTSYTPKAAGKHLADFY